MSGFHHASVLREEVVAALRPSNGERIVDCTLGGGGHAEALLEAAECHVLGIDRDPAAIEAATARCRRFGARFATARASFSSFGAVLDGHGWDQVDGVLADLGVSSYQIDTPHRGFSFQRSGPIDMRMDPDAERSAADLVNSMPESELADLIYTFGEERRSRRVARAIVEGRPWHDTLALASRIAAVVGSSGKIHPATRTFQALRIATNQELDELRVLLGEAVGRLSPGGRLAIISFHSLEDRIVKHFLAAAAGKGRPRDAYGNPVGEILLDLESSKVPGPADPNPRARSARLRAAVRRS